MPSPEMGGAIRVLLTNKIQKKMEKKKFEQCEIQVIKLESNDCIQTSGGGCDLVENTCPTDSGEKNHIWDR